MNKLNNKNYKTQNFRNKINNIEEENDEVNDLFTDNNKNLDKINKMYKKNSNQTYKTVNDDEQFNFDLREFINSKIKSSSKRLLVKPGHHRSNSTNLYNY